MPDPFSDRHRRASDPAITVFEIVPDDTEDLATFTTALNVATPGVVRITAVDGSTADVTIHPGQSFPVRARRVWYSGTTATGIRGLA